MASAPNLYQPCPCGSGKQLKWCCRDYYSDFDKAEKALQSNQPEVAIGILKSLTEKHPKVPQLWCKYAEFLGQLQRLEECEKAVDQALTLDPNNAFATFQKGLLRMGEGEIEGGLILYRRALERTNAESAILRVQLAAEIANIELRFNRGPAVRAALEIAAKTMPTDPNVQKTIKDLDNNESPLLPSAAKSRKLRPAPAGQESAWATAMGAVETGKLSEVVRVFETLSETPSSAAYFNLGLAYAWIGNNDRALTALLKSLELDDDPVRLTETGHLCEILRLGAGMEEKCDALVYLSAGELRDPQAFARWIERWAREGRFRWLNRDDKNKTFLASILDSSPPSLIDQPMAIRHRIATLYYENGAIRFASYDSARLRSVLDEILQLEPSIFGQVVDLMPSASADAILQPAMAFPIEASMTEEKAAEFDRIQQKLVADLLDKDWIKQPLRSLDGVSPLDAAAHPGMRKRLFGLLEYLAEVIEMYLAPGTYDVDRLRRRLGLIAGVTSGASIDFETISTADLARIDPSALTDGQLSDAFQSALRLDSPDLAGKFAGFACDRSAITDRYPYFNHRIQSARSDGNLAEVERLVEAALTADSATNGGARRGDLTMLLIKNQAARGDIEGADTRLRELTAANPSDFKMLGTAAEMMLRAGKKALALDYIQKGLAECRRTQNRDGEGMFLDLQKSAERLSG